MHPLELPTDLYHPGHPRRGLIQLPRGELGTSLSHASIPAPLSVKGTCHQKDHKLPSWPGRESLVKKNLAKPGRVNKGRGPCPSLKQRSFAPFERPIICSMIYGATVVREKYNYLDQARLTLIPSSFVSRVAHLLPYISVQL